MPRILKRVPLIDLTSGPCQFIETYESDSSGLVEEPTLEEHHRNRMWHFKRVDEEKVNGVVVHTGQKEKTPPWWIEYLLFQNSLLRAYNYITNIQIVHSPLEGKQWVDRDLDAEKVKLPNQDIRDILFFSAALRVHQYMSAELAPRRQYTDTYAKWLLQDSRSCSTHSAFPSASYHLKGV